MTLRIWVGLTFLSSPTPQSGKRRCPTVGAYIHTYIRTALSRAPSGGVWGTDKVSRVVGVVHLLFIAASILPLPPLGVPALPCAARESDLRSCRNAVKKQRGKTEASHPLRKPHGASYVIVVGAAAQGCPWELTTDRICQKLAPFQNDDSGWGRAAVIGPHDTPIRYPIGPGKVKIPVASFP